MNKPDTFTPKDLLDYVKSVVRVSTRDNRDTGSNYAWLRSRHLSVAEDNSLDKYESMVRKLSPESCTAIAVKLDTLTEGTQMSSDDVIKMFEKLLEEQESIQLLQLVDKGEKKIPARLGKRRATIAFISY
ncbi:uncharacterized protein LOC125055589 [Pieris napi]|uniref:uncharacterized protein LOC125055589 n=1 Tax=Pieris napi TaxID=78633 RepID=UPI001FBB613A|nr:uncharacterized protein LOC125055589 [Pieris napi]